MNLPDSIAHSIDCPCGQIANLKSLWLFITLRKGVLDEKIKLKELYDLFKSEKQE